MCIFELFEGATVNSVNRVSECFKCFARMSVWMALSLAVQESHRSPRAVPRGEEGSSYACGPFLCECERFPVWFQFCSILCKEPSDQCTCCPCSRVICSLSEYWPSPCISVSGLLCQLFVFCRSRCEPGPIPIFLVMLFNRSCLFTQFCTKYCISVVLAQWRQVPPENTVLICVCSKCAKWEIFMIFTIKEVWTEKSGNCGFSFGISWSRTQQACAACNIWHPIWDQEQFCQRARKWHFARKLTFYDISPPFPQNRHLHQNDWIGDPQCNSAYLLWAQYFSG